MIFEQIMNGSSASFGETVAVIVFMAIISILSITLREYVRARVTAKLGGEAKATLNPINSLNIPNAISVIILAFFSVSWTKPQKPSLSAGKNALIAVSAPLTNIILALASMLVYDILYIINVNIYVATEAYPTVLIWISMFFSSAVLVNLGYALFSILPVPGTDGGLLIAQIMPEKIREKFLYFDKFSYIVLFFLALIASRSGVSATIINTAATSVESVFLAVFSFMFPVN